MQTATRLEKLTEIQNYLKMKGGKATFEEVYGDVTLKYGTTTDTLWNYLEALQIAGKIVYTGIDLEDTEITLKE